VLTLGCWLETILLKTKRTQPAPRPKISRDSVGSNRAPAVTRAASVLRLLASEQAGIGVSEIARRVGLVPSTCFHVLRALVDEGFIAFDDEKKTYRTGVGLLTLVREAMANSEFPRVVQPVLDGLTDKNNVTALGIELDSQERERMVIVALSRSDNFVSLHVAIGSRFPAWISATGRCVAAQSGLSREALRKRFDALRWEKAPRFEDWYSSVEQAGAEGVGIDRGSYVRGLTILTALLPRGADRALRGISLIGFEHHMTERSLRQLKDQLKAAVSTVAARLN
jgi:DNA-binding IclR family transcriptional regulator